MKQQMKGQEEISSSTSMGEEMFSMSNKRFNFYLTFPSNTGIKIFSRISPGI
jgi:hypothetical protein